MQRPNESFSGEFHPGDLKSTICMTGMSHLPEWGILVKLLRVGSEAVETASCYRCTGAHEPSLRIRTRVVMAISLSPHPLHCQGFARIFNLNLVA